MNLKKYFGLSSDKKQAEAKKRFLQYADKAISRSRKDIKDWNDALGNAQSDDPKNFALQLLFREIRIDAHLTSQIENRKQQIFSSDFSLKNKNGDTDEEQTELLKKLPAYRLLTDAVLECIYHGYSLVELQLERNLSGTQNLLVHDIPRTNVVPQTGKFYPDYSEDKFTLYREMKEYGTWILEFNKGDFGLLNKAVSHVLFKRFAQSCWSELCEIYGIPPRVLHTNTQDPVMLKRAEKMMSETGAAPWWIIDETEKMEWAEGIATNGDVFRNLIALCTNEISLLISGAVIGQDTVNGNRSKDESSQEMLWQLVQSDMALLEEKWNHAIIPALIKIGVLKGDIRFEFNPTEDLKQLWAVTKDSLQYFKVDPDWVKEKFGVEITGEREQPMAIAGEELSITRTEGDGSDFFG